MPLLGKKVQAYGYAMLAEGALPDSETETDERFQHAGEKRQRHSDPTDPPRRHANKRFAKYNGTFERICERYKQSALAKSRRCCTDRQS